MPARDGGETFVFNNNAVQNQHLDINTRGSLTAASVTGGSFAQAAAGTNAGVINSETTLE